MAIYKNNSHKGHIIFSSEDLTTDEINNNVEFINSNGEKLLVDMWMYVRYFFENIQYKDINNDYVYVDGCITPVIMCRKYLHVKPECGIIDNKTELEPIDDAAAVNWGEEWKIPTINQLGELFNERYTILKWLERNGIGGMEITSKQNGNSIFLPASGGVGSYWSSSLETNYRRCAQRLRFDLHNCKAGYCYFSDGGSIRPVRTVSDKQQNT